MALLKISPRTNMYPLDYLSPYRGTALLEVLVVLGLITLLSATTAFLNLDEYGRALAGDDTARIETMLRHARGQAQAGVCREAPCDERKVHGMVLTPAAIHPLEATSQEGVATETLSNPLSLSNTLSFTPTTIFFAPHGVHPTKLHTLTATTTLGSVWRFSITEAGLISANLYLP